MCHLEPSYAYVNFSRLSITSVMASNIWMGYCLVLSSDFYCKENEGTTGAAHLIQTSLTIFPGIRRVRSLANQRSLVFRQRKLSQMRCSNRPSFSSESKSDESTKHHLSQMLLATDWRYWQAGKKSHMRMKVQGRSCKGASLKSTKFPQKQNRILF